VAKRLVHLRGDSFRLLYIIYKFTVSSRQARVVTESQHHRNSCQHIFNMADKMAFLLFGDQSLDTHGFLADFCRQGNPSILAKVFMERAGQVLREEVDGLGALERAKVPNFRTLQQLNEKYHAQSIKHPGIDSALLCIAQLAHYIE
jgi:hypothetical protein